MVGAFGISIQAGIGGFVSSATVRLVLFETAPSSLYIEQT
jgi:hypothetical protein